MYIYIYVYIVHIYICIHIYLSLSIYIYICIHTLIISISILLIPAWPRTPRHGGLSRLDAALHPYDACYVFYWLCCVSDCTSYVRTWRDQRHAPSARADPLMPQPVLRPPTPNLPTNIIPTNIA